MIVRFTRVSHLLYQAQWNGRNITVASSHSLGPWTLKVDGKPMPVFGSATSPSPSKAFRAVEHAAQNILAAAVRTSVVRANQHRA